MENNRSDRDPEFIRMRIGRAEKARRDGLEQIQRIQRTYLSHVQQFFWMLNPAVERFLDQVKPFVAEHEISVEPFTSSLDDFAITSEMLAEPLQNKPRKPKSGPGPDLDW